jgi:hypothetical protein
MRLPTERSQPQPWPLPAVALVLVGDPDQLASVIDQRTQQ